MTVTDDIRYIGVNDHEIDLFEGQFEVPLGMAYNSYVIIDEKIAVMDTVDRRFGNEWLENLKAALAGRNPDYLIVQHMEPDHSSNILLFRETWPEAVIVSSDKAFAMMKNFFGIEKDEGCLTIKEGDVLKLGKHELRFIAAPMVHWPEVMMTYDATGKVLFSADGFGKFGANDVEDPEGWACEARRYYFGIVGKFGAQVQMVLKKTAALYNGGIFPVMKQFIDHLTERGYKNRTIAFIENGSWAPQAASIMRKMLEGCKNVSFAETVVSIRSGVKEENINQINMLADELMKGE